MNARRSQIEFLTLLAFTQIECGRYGDAIDILRAVQMVDERNADASRLLALAQLRHGDAQGCLETIDQHQQRFGLKDKARQMTWLRIRGLYGAGQVELSRQLLHELRREIQEQDNDCQWVDARSAYQSRT